MNDLMTIRDTSQPRTADVLAMSTKHKSRLCFLINSMEGGGAERAMANLLHHLEGPLSDMQVDLVLLDDLPVVQNIPAWVRVVTLDGRGSMLYSAVALARYFRSARPDLCISYLSRSNSLNVMLSAFTRHRAVISERVQTTSHLSTSRAAALYRLITRLTYPRAFRVIAVSEGVASDLVNHFNVLREKTCVIGNPIDTVALSRAGSEPPPIPLPERYILAVGRMVVNKNFQMLLEGYAKAQPSADLVILGEGPERASLERQVAALGLQGRVHMPGFIKNPYPVMTRAEAMVSCSNAEGFPNTLIESLSLGVPVIATDCPSGPAMVLRGNADAATPIEENAHDGLLIRMGNSDDLARALSIYGTAEIRNRYAALARARAAAFGVKAVVQEYIDIIETSMRPDPHLRS